MDIAQISDLLKIADLAVAYGQAELRLRAEKQNMDAVYREWREDNGHSNYVERGSSEWDKMLFDTQVDYALLKEARRQVYNAKRRLTNATRRYMTESV